MNTSRFEAQAREVGLSLAGARVTKIFHPDRWTLGLSLGPRGTLGFCWHPEWLAAGLCGWKWQKKAVPDRLRASLEGARVLESSTLKGEPVFFLSLGGSVASRVVFECLGRSSNLLVLDKSETILWSGRVLGGEQRDGREGSRWIPPLGPGTCYAEPMPVEGGEKRLYPGLVERAKSGRLKEFQSREVKLRRRILAVTGDRHEGIDWIGLEGVATGLLATGKLASRGEVTRKCVDYSKNPPVEVKIQLDPALTIQQNAEAFFAKARKGKRRLARTEELLAELDRELASLMQAKAEVERTGELDAVIQGVQATRERGRTPKAERLPTGVRRVILPSGFVGYAGKSATGNDIVSFRIGNGGDFWFHVKDYPGCHLVVKNTSRLESLPHAVEMAAALMAAHGSQAPPGNRIGVIVAQCKSLRRIRGSPGQVALSRSRTVFVDLPSR